MSRRVPWILALIGLAVLVAFQWGGEKGGPESVDGQDEVWVGAADFVGRATCASCHPQETSLWEGSHHDLAMQLAGAETVLGDFDSASFEHRGVRSSFERRGADFFVTTDGPDGKPTEFRITHAFGVDPLQQYLVELPGGRYQALPLAWDTRPASEGGERWFHLYPGERLSHRDALHWTGPNQNWNFMCAECHSTDLQKRYRLEEDAYETSWFELDVSCEACHGPGSGHVEWARSKPSLPPKSARAAGLLVELRDHDDASWVFDEGQSVARREPQRTSQPQVDACARCHARRSVLLEPYEYGRPFLDTHRPAFLAEGLYHADGQIQDEVYVYGSFLQSKMYHAGVTCTDCHDAHSTKLIGGLDDACSRCHLPQVFATPEHTHHAPGSPGSSCVECHMPEQTYMVVDPRRDHSMRVPRPDLAATLGAPDACSGCHAEEDRAWVVGAFGDWYPERARTPHYGSSLQLGREGGRGAGMALVQLAADAEQPGIARGTALSLLGSYPGPPAYAVIRAATLDPDPIVRLGALDGAVTCTTQERREIALRLLDDPVRGVRIEAARLIGELPLASLSAADRDRLERALEEYRRVQETNGDRAGSHMNLGTLSLERGDPAATEEHYRRAIEVDPSFGPAYVNLADLYRLTARDPEGESILRQGTDASPDDGYLRYALGLVLVRLERDAEAIEQFALAWELQAGVPDHGFALGASRIEAGMLDEGLEALREVHARFPYHGYTLSLLAETLRGRGDVAEAQTYERELRELQSGPR